MLKYSKMSLKTSLKFFFLFLSIEDQLFQNGNLDYFLNSFYGCRINDGILWDNLITEFEWKM
jgi:hypothetical protein